MALEADNITGNGKIKVCSVALQNLVVSTVYRVGLCKFLRIKGGCWNSIVF